MDGREEGDGAGGGGGGDLELGGGGCEQGVAGQRGGETAVACQGCLLDGQRVEGEWSQVRNNHLGAVGSLQPAGVLRVVQVAVVDHHPGHFWAQLLAAAQDDAVKGLALLSE